MTSVINILMISDLSMSDLDLCFSKDDRQLTAIERKMLIMMMKRDSPHDRRKDEIFVPQLLIELFIFMVCRKYRAVEDTIKTSVKPIMETIVLTFLC